jgi:hypothetical protein
VLSSSSPDDDPHNRKELMTNEQYDAYAAIPPDLAFFEVRNGNWSAEDFEEWYTVQIMEVQSQSNYD